jgi:hypothetical protein
MNLFLCPECICTGNIDPPIITGRKAWQEHVNEYHDGAAKEYKLEELVKLLDIILHYPCLLCGYCYYRRSYLQEYLKLAYKELIKNTPL